jgi:hypothetical protein
MEAAIRIGLNARMNIIIGFPHETRRDIYQSARFCLRMARKGLDDCFRWLFSAYPGSELYQQLKADGSVPEPCDDYFVSLHGMSNFAPSVSKSSRLPLWELNLCRVSIAILFDAIAYLLYPRRLARLLRTSIRREPFSAQNPSGISICRATELRSNGTCITRAFPMTNRNRYLIGFTVLSVGAAFLLPAMPQPVAYHDFADHREMFGVANFLDVASNLGFLLVALAGFAVVLRPHTRFESSGERMPWIVFFFGMLLTALGSAYYHLAPDNERLFWDRLPMTIAFMALLSAQVGDRISVRMGLILLLPMLLIGASSVFYWRMTERAGVGNVMPYGVLQAYSVVVLLLIGTLPSRYTHGNDVYWVFAAYVIAKLLETFDRQILSLGHLTSGHTLKHLAAAVAGVVVCRMLLLRTLRDPAAAPGS